MRDTFQPAVYILASRKRGTIYIGCTSNLLQRLHQHREGLIPGFTRRYGIRRLVWFEIYETMEAAILREKQLKKWNRAWKVRLIDEGNPSWRDLWPDITGQLPRAKSMDSRLRGNDD